MEYLNISEPVVFDNTIEKFEYATAEPQNQTLYNKIQDTIITFTPSSEWYLPSQSYLYVEGRLLQRPAGSADNVPYVEFTKDHGGQWPDIVLTNNFFPYLYSQMRYRLNDYEIEQFAYPGQCTTMKHLLTNSSSFNGLDMGWAIDTYDGQVPKYDFNYQAIRLTNADMPTAGADPTAAEYRAIVNTVITVFNEANGGLPAIPPLDDASLPCAGANPTHDEIQTGLNNLIYRINTIVDAEEIPNIVVGAGATSDVLRTAIIAACTAINAKTVRYNVYGVDSVNSGFTARKNRLFNKVTNIMPDNQAGHFSFRIPLKWLFNFCSDYTKVIFGAKHELILARQSNEFAIFKNRFVDQDTMVSIDLVRWYMPKITPNLQMKAMLDGQLAAKIEAPIGFMNKKIERFDVTPSVSTFSAMLTYSQGVEKPRYIVAAFQSVDKTAAGYGDNRNINHSIFNGTNLGGRSIAMIDVRTINVNINGTSYNLADQTNNASTNQYARWYNEYKKFKVNYSGDISEDDIVSYQDFINLYRLYVLDISKQSETIVGGVATVRLEFQFNGTIPAVGDCEVQLYVLSFFDRVGILKTDGQKQYFEV